MQIYLIFIYSLLPKMFRVVSFIFMLRFKKEWKSYRNTITKEWNGKEWDQMGWEGMGWDGIIWNGTRMSWKPQIPIQIFPVHLGFLPSFWGSVNTQLKC